MTGAGEQVQLVRGAAFVRLGRDGDIHGVHGAAPDGLFLNDARHLSRRRLTAGADFADLFALRTEYRDFAEPDAVRDSRATDDGARFEYRRGAWQARTTVTCRPAPRRWTGRRTGRGRAPCAGGSARPHDNALIALGLARYGLTEEVRTLSEGLVAAARCGHRRSPRSSPATTARPPRHPSRTRTPALPGRGPRRLRRPCGRRRSRRAPGAPPVRPGERDPPGGRAAPRTPGRARPVPPEA
ncbi:hypothetical protein GCM10019016_099670 [Streptomyces prasinosporus]|uniref:Putative glycogen debranching enzyme N-terminal domain-containing protein n=1 Tax=Streptomyces prasinosporus TaxID=68256 RepID=A0ABP6U837_9ACTN